MIDPIESGHLLKKAIKESGSSVSEVGKQIGISATAIYNWLRGESIPSIDNLFILAELLHKRPDELISYTPILVNKKAA